MTIDEAIHKHKKLKIFAEGTNDKRAKEEHEQHAEWLEELKKYKEKPEGWMWDEAEMKGYNKAIDDFVKYIDDCSGWTQNCIEHDISLTVYTLHQIAEQLKAGETE